MRVAERSSPFGYTLFCDDIRLEANGKVMFIGTYAGTMIVRNALPIALPKLAMQVNYSERPGESTEPVELRIYLPDSPDDEPHMKSMIPIEQMRARPLPEPSPGSDQWLTVLVHVDIAPLPLAKEGLIRVRAYRGDLEVRLGSLRVVQQPSAAAAEQAQPPAT